MAAADLPTWDRGVLPLVLDRASRLGETTSKTNIDKHVHDESYELVRQLVDEGWLLEVESGALYGPTLKAMLPVVVKFDGIVELLDSAIKYARAQFERRDRTALGVSDIFENYRSEGRRLFEDDSSLAFWVLCGLMELGPFITWQAKNRGLPTRLTVSPSIQRVSCLADVLSEQQEMALKVPGVPLPISSGAGSSTILLNVRRDSAALGLNLSVKSATERFLGPPILSPLAIEHAREAFLAWGSAATALLESIFADRRVATEFSDRVKVRTIGGGTLLAPAPDLNELKLDLKMGVLGCIDYLKVLIKSLPRYQEPANAPYLPGTGPIEVFNNLNRAFKADLIPETNDAEVAVPKPTSRTTPVIFISHSSKDEKLATCLTDLLRAALHLRADEIRCTSVPGSKLPTGVDSATTLRGEIATCKVFIGLLTQQSVESAYVLFELGAGWGLQKRLFPLLGPGVGFDILPPPIRGQHGQKTAVRQDMQQVLGEIAKELGIDLEPAESFESKFADVLSYAPKPP